MSQLSIHSVTTRMPPPRAAQTRSSSQIQVPRKLSSEETARGFVLAVLVAVAAVLRFAYLTRKSFWFDEGVSVQIARLDWYNFRRLLWRREANMSLYYLLLRGWLHLGSSEYLVRGLSVVFAVLTVPAIYYLGRRLFDARTGQIAALLLAVNGFHIAYSQEARSYSLFVLLTSLSVLFFVEALHSPHPRTLRLHVAASTLAVYAHFFAVLLIPVEWLFARSASSGNALRMRRNWRWIAIMVSPTFLFVLTTGAGPLAWIQRPTFRDLYALLLSLCGDGGWLLAAVYIVACALAFLPPSANTLLDARQQWSARFLLCWIVFPLVTMFAVSQFRPLFLTRYFIFLLPPVVLLAARGVTRFSSPWFITAALAIFVGLSLHADLAYYAKSLNLEHEDWRSATSYVLSNMQNGDAVIFHTGMGRMPFEYYRDRQSEPAVLFPYSRTQITYRDFLGHPDADLLVPTASRYSRVWIVFSHNQGKTPEGVDAPTRRLTQVFGSSYSRMEVKSFPGVELYLYSERSSTQR